MRTDANLTALAKLLATKKGRARLGVKDEVTVEAERISCGVMKRIAVGVKLLDYIVAIDNNIGKGGWDLSPVELKVFQLAVSMVNGSVECNINDDLLIRVSIKDLSSFSRISLSDAKRQLRKCGSEDKSIVKCVVQYWDDHQKTTDITPIFKHARYDEEAKCLELSFSPKFMPFITNLKGKGKFTKHTLRETQFLDSHAYKLMLFLKSHYNHFNKQAYTVSLTTLKEAFNAQFQRTNNFIAQVLKPSIAQLKDLGWDLRFELKGTGRAGKIKEVRFSYTQPSITRVI